MKREKVVFLKCNKKEKSIGQWVVLFNKWPEEGTLHSKKWVNLTKGWHWFFFSPNCIANFILFTPDSWGCHSPLIHFQQQHSGTDLYFVYFPGCNSIQQHILHFLRYINTIFSHLTCGFIVFYLLSSSFFML